MSSQNPCLPFVRQASRLSGVGSSDGPSVATTCRIEPCALSPSRSATLAGAVLGRAGVTVRLLDFRASARVLQLLQDALGLFPVDALLDLLGRLVYQVLAFLEAQAGDCDSFCVRRASSVRASLDIGACMILARLPSGACIAPSRRLSRISREGRSASSVTASALITWPSSRPALITILRLARKYSLRIRAGAETSSAANSIAIGPTSSALSGS